ncbi:MAG: hypothetical protein FJX73_06015 [Armatimonadetes bacterium]|nr:hypothetical protein [Armatimonadota bacterium]
MFGAIVKRTLLALIPIAILTTAGLALTGVTQLPVKFVSTPTEEEAVAPPATDPAAVPQKTLVAQNQPSAQPDQIAQASEQAEAVEEPLPVLVVDKTALASALTEIDRAAAQAKLAVTALDADAQQRYIQETINLLAGSADPLFQRLAQAGNGDVYKGVRPLLIEARVIREAAEVQWIAAVQRQIEASARKHAELVAQAGTGTGVTPQPAPASATAEIAAVVGPTGVLGTRGMRPEEQAADLVSRAIRQAAEALRAIANRPQGSFQDGTVDIHHASDQASQTMEAVLRMLDSARKIIQIAADR